MAFHALEPVRQGPVSVKAGFLSSWRGWTDKWLVLKPTSLTLYKNRLKPETAKSISLNGITRLERTHSRSRAHCLLLDAGGTRYLFAFRSDRELYGWHDAIYSISPLTLFKAGENSTEIDLENVIIRNYSADSPDTSSFSHISSPLSPPRKKTFLPDQVQLFRPSTHSPASSRQLLVDTDELRTRKSSPSLHHPVEVVPASSPTPPLPPALAPVSLRAPERAVIRDAVTLLCNIMEPRLLRKSEPGGEKPVDLIEMRLRALARMKRRWGKPQGNITNNISEEEEMRTFAEALRDGYVLCQLLNTLQGSTVLRPDDRAHASGSLNITKFLAAAAAAGLQRAELFLPLDLEEASGYSLTRVASTIVALVHVNEASTPTSHSAPSSPESSAIRPLPAVPSSGENRIERASAELAQWSANFISLTREKMVTDQDSADSDDGGFIEERVSGFEFANSKVYEHLIAFVSQSEACQDLRFRSALEKVVRFMASLDPVWSLVQSAQFRVQLLKISSILGLANDRRLREALHKDDVDIARLFRQVVSTEVHKKAVCRLKGESAQNCVDLIQDVLDKGTLQSAGPDEGFTLKLRRCLVKLSEMSDRLPASLFIRGVLRLDKDAMFGGTFGDIYRASYHGQDVALKRIRVFQRDNGRHKIRQRFCREALLWQRLQHPFVLPFTGIDAESFPSFLCMVSPWMRHGTILKHLAENGNANVELRLFEIAQGLAYLHSQDTVHGDLRGSNILVDEGWHARLADFGLAVFSDATLATQSSHRGGSVRWMSPELHYPQSCGLETFQRTFASDVYSFAFVCIELFTGKPPFSEVSHDAAVMLRVMAKERPARPCDPEGRVLMSDQLWAIVQQCWSHEVAERPSMARVVQLMQEGREELHLTTPAFLAEVPRTPGEKPSYMVHRPSRRRPKGPATTVYQSLSF